MPISRRYSPEWASGDSSLIGMDFSAMIPPGVCLTSGALAIATNTQPPVASTDFTIGTPAVSGRTTYAEITGGVAGTDYQLTWTVNDTDGNIFSRTALMLCAPTS